MGDVVRRDELEGALEARRELGHDYEAEVLDAFLEKVERRIDERLRAAPERRPGPPALALVALPLGSLGFAIPLIAIAGERAGGVGVFFVCLAIVLVNFFSIFYAFGRR